MLSILLGSNLIFPLLLILLGVWCPPGAHGTINIKPNGKPALGIEELQLPFETSRPTSESSSKELDLGCKLNQAWTRPDLDLT